MIQQRASRRAMLYTASLALVLITACATADGPGAPRRSPTRSASTDGDTANNAPDADGFHELVSAAGTWRVDYRTEPSPIPLNEPFVVFVRVARNGTTRYLPELPVRVDAAMPQHQHGMNRIPEHSRVSPELIRADGLLFHMVGAWTLTFDVTEGAITERAEVVVDVR